MATEKRLNAKRKRNIDIFIKFKIPKNIVNKLNKKARPDNVCADCMNFNLKFNILTCDKYLIADLSLELIFLFINSSCIFLIKRLKDEYLFPKDIIIKGIAGNKNAA